MLRKLPAVGEKLAINHFQLIALASLGVALVFVRPLAGLLEVWLTVPEQGHGLLLAAIAIAICYKRRVAIANAGAEGNWAGLALLFAAVVLCIGGVLADIQVVQYYALVLSLLAVPILLGGAAQIKPMVLPYLLLVISLPLPYLVGKLLTQQLQTVSASLGVYFIQMMGMPAFREGNIIDMGSFVLLVEEACSGLRYLFPLASLGFLAAAFLRTRWLFKILLFLLSVPITIVMNSIRIAIAGWLIKNYGEQTARGFLHFFEGWVVFLTACLLLFLILMLLAYIKSRKFHLSEILALQDKWKIDGLSSPAHLSVKTMALFLALVCSATVFAAISASKEIREPEKQSFAEIPLSVGEYEFFPDVLPDTLQRVLNADEIFIGDYMRRRSLPINVYMAYYGRQREGSVIHSPDDCLPGGGWEITQSSIVDLSQFGLQGLANRVVIEKNGEQLLAYYWVNQQGKNYASVMKARAALLYRAVIYGRTDGTLVRIIVPVEKAVSEADAEVSAFIRQFVEVVDKYLPV